MARYKPIDMSPKLITVDFTRQILPGSFEYALCYLIDHEMDLSLAAQDYPSGLLARAGEFACHGKCLSAECALYGRLWRCHTTFHHSGDVRQHGRRSIVSAFYPSVAGL